MRSRTAIWFECKIQYEKTMEDGLQKKVTESYTVDALSFTEAEKRIMEEMFPTACKPSSKKTARAMRRNGTT